MNQLLTVFLIVVSATFVSATLFTPCGGSATAFNINIQGCEDGVNDRCIFIKGNTYGITVGGVSNTSALSLNTTIKAICCAIPITLYEIDACENLQVGECPIEVGEEFVNDRMTFNVTNYHPQLEADVLIETRNEDKELMLCGRFKIRIIKNGIDKDHIN